MAILRDDEEELNSQAPQAGAPAGGTAAPAMGARPKYTQSSFTSGKQLLQKNADSGSPNLIGGFRKKAEEAEQGLNKARGEYQQNIEGQRAGSRVSADEVNQGVMGDQAAFGKIKGLLGQPQQLGQFDYKSGLDIQDINRLQNEAGTMGALREQAQQRGDYGYSRGQSSLDAYLFGKSPGGRQQQVGEALSKRSQVEGLVDQAKAEEARRRESAQGEIGQNVSNLRTNLGGRSERLARDARDLAPMIQATKVKEEQARSSQALMDKAKADAQRLAQGYSKEKDLISGYDYGMGMAQPTYSPNAATPDKMDEVKGQSLKDLGLKNNLQDTIYANIMNQIKANKGLYTDVGYTKDDAYYDEDTAGRFNRINELLGNQDRAQIDDYSNIQGSGAFGKTYDQLVKNSLKPLEQLAKDKKKAGKQSQAAIQAGKDNPEDGSQAPSEVATKPTKKGEKK